MTRADYVCVHGLVLVGVLAVSINSQLVRGVALIQAQSSRFRSAPTRSRGIFRGNFPTPALDALVLHI